MCESSFKDILPITYLVTSLNDLEPSVIKERILSIWAIASERDLGKLTSILLSARSPQVEDAIIITAQEGKDEPIHRRLTAVVVGTLKLADLGGGP